MLNAILSILILIAGYITYRYLLLPSSLRRSPPSDRADNSEEIYWRRITTAFFYGGLTIVAIYLTGSELRDFGIGISNFQDDIFPGILIGLLLIAVNLFNYRTEENLASFPEIRRSHWHISTFTLSALTWVVYLLAYEMLFRGYLLFSMNDTFGRWPAIIINIILYSLVHYHKGWKETIGAIPLGLALSLVCLASGSFLPAFIAHIFLALSCEWLSFHANPGFSWSIRR